MLPADLKKNLQTKIATVSHPRELVVDVLFDIQMHYGHLTDEAIHEAAELCGMAPVEVEELATFYTFTFREPVGKYVIHVCDSVVCWMNGYQTIREYLCSKLNINMGETTPDGLFTLIPVCCIGYCDRSPAILVNRKVHGSLTPAKLDQLIEKIKMENPAHVE
ncbi:MAG: NADH-quinone oxidoreductase subunit NuoE [Desulfobacteraceae bacterium]|nr:NADH-quinone oxidoreductase subunit NuoE [Desulfobacteraceae bacterium]